ANVLPDMVAEMVEAFPGRPSRAAELHHALRPISKALFFETSPGPIKYAMAELGLIESDELRAPLVGVTEQTKARMAAALGAIRDARG
ncbi:MAG: dihydrodipicolinate synthase family protein, partial [Candidatus Eisenbacteria sp.]|nr:dihydrodipicolinate synthase family protein [Candidatus Eisenbacteria bacterium]